MSFKKTLKQNEAVKMLSGAAKYCMAFGGSRSGKTAILCYSIIVRACKIKSRHVILRLNFNHAKTSIFLDTMPKIFKIAFPDLKVLVNKTDYYYTLPNGSEIWIAGLDDEKRVEKILGKEYSTLYFNETSQIPYRSYSVALTRLAEKNDLKKKVYLDCNPPNKRHWTYQLFILGLCPVESTPIEKTDYASILMNPKDNIENIDEDYIKGVLDKMPEKERARFRDGLFVDDSDGCAYYEFNRINHVKKLTTRAGSLFVALDFNVQPMTAVIAQIVNENINVVDEVFLENSDTFKMCGELKRRGYAGLKVIPDSTGANRRTSGISDHLILKQQGFDVVPTFNPHVKDRVNNVNRLLMAGRINIDDRCKRLIGDLEKVQWKNEELDQKTDKMLTHISDALGYLCWRLFPIRIESTHSISNKR